MVKLHDFVYCESQISPQTVFYSVAVGESQRDKSALAQVKSMVWNDNRFFFSIHSLANARFFERIRESLFSSLQRSSHSPWPQLRTKRVTIAWLRSFLRNNPPELLNSQRVGTDDHFPSFV